MNATTIVPGFFADASGYAECHQDGPGGLSWHATESAYASARGLSNVYMVFYHASYVGDHLGSDKEEKLYQNDLQTPRVSVGDSWSGSVGIGTQVSVATQAFATLGPVVLATDAGGGTDTCYF